MKGWEGGGLQGTEKGESSMKKRSQDGDVAERVGVTLMWWWGRGEGRLMVSLCAVGGAERGREGNRGVE